MTAEANPAILSFLCTDGDARATLDKLATPRKKFYDKIAHHGIDPNSFRK